MKAEKMLYAHMNLGCKTDKPTSENDMKAQALNKQVGGDHYKKYAIQPIEFIYANNIPFIEGCVIKYVARWRDKGGLADLEKAKHFLEMLIDLEEKKP